MTDLSTTLSSILVSTHKSTPLESHSFSRTNVDAFLSEAYAIHASIRSLLSYLRTLRTPYLSTAPPPRANTRRNQSSPVSTSLGDVPSYLSDSQREAIDTQTSSLLRDVNANITNLQKAANLRHETAQQRIQKKYGKPPSNFLTRWAGGGTTLDEDAGKSEQRLQEEGREKTTHSFREGVLWYLNHKLRETVSTQQEMVEIRLEREREKRASILYDAQNRNVRLQQQPQPQSQSRRFGDDSEDSNNNNTDPVARLGITDMQARDTYNPSLDPSNADPTLQQTLTPEQLQLFESENASLVNLYTDQLAQVTQAEKSLIEISELQQTLVSHLTVQGEMIGNLVENAERTDENVVKGNKELKRATERTSTARLMYHATLWICGVLVVWDLIF